MRNVYMLYWYDEGYGDCWPERRLDAAYSNIRAARRNARRYAQSINYRNHGWPCKTEIVAIPMRSK
jgi:hypothetical protein